MADVAAALETPESKAEFLVITDDDVLEGMLSAPLQRWRVFLHPSQRRLVERQWSGAVRVLETMLGAVCGCGARGGGMMVRREI